MRCIKRGEHILTYINSTWFNYMHILSTLGWFKSTFILLKQNLGWSLMGEKNIILENYPHNEPIRLELD